MLLKIARASLWNRRGTVALCALSIAVSVALLLAVERVRGEAHRGFASSVSGTDLIVGARTGALQLLLFSVFRIGEPSASLRWDSYQALTALPQVAWAIPVSLGDSHRGHRVLGTTAAYFEHFRYGRQQALQFAEGQAFDGVQQVVLGAQVARQLGYRIADELVLTHGGGRADIMRHEDAPFRVVGVLASTGTPVDRSLHVSLESIDAIHADWLHGIRLPHRTDSRPAAPPRTLSAVFLGLHNRTSALGLQRQVNEFAGEPLLAILPALTLAQLWSLIAPAEAALQLVAACVVLAGLIGLATALLTTLAERRRELAILRALGARPWQIAALLVLEAGAIALAGALGGTLALSTLLALGAPWLLSSYGLAVSPLAFTPREPYLLAMVLGGGLSTGLPPAWLAWRRTLADGLTLRT